jgi:hypothetical protein
VKHKNQILYLQSYAKTCTVLSNSNYPELELALVVLVVLVALAELLEMEIPTIGTGMDRQRWSLMAIITQQHFAYRKLAIISS